MRPASRSDVRKPSLDTHASGMAGNISHYGGVLVFVGIHMMGLYCRADRN